MQKIVMVVIAVVMISGCAMSRSELLVWEETTARKSIDNADSAQQAAKMFNNVENKFRKYLDKNPCDFEVESKLAHFYADYPNKENNKKAEAIWRDLIVRNPDEKETAFYYNAIACTIDHQNRRVEAMELLAKAISLKPDEPEFHLNLANYYSLFRKEACLKYNLTQAELFWKIAKEYGEARKLEPGNEEYARLYAEQFIIASKFGVDKTADKALEAWDFYLKIPGLTKQQRAFALTNKARILLREKNDNKAAAELLREAVKLHSTLSSEDLLKLCK